MSTAFIEELEADSRLVVRPALKAYIKAELALADSIHAATIDRADLARRFEELHRAAIALSEERRKQEQADLELLRSANDAGEVLHAKNRRLESLLARFN